MGQTETQLEDSQELIKTLRNRCCHVEQRMLGGAAMYGGIDEVRIELRKKGITLILDEGLATVRLLTTHVGVVLRYEIAYR